MNFFKRKKKAEPEKKKIDWAAIAAGEETRELTEKDFHDFFSAIFAEPMTDAAIRLKEGASDYGAKRGIRAYNEHLKSIDTWSRSAVAISERRINTSNQWINGAQSVNAGFSTAQLSYYLFQVVNYYDCMIQAQDPLMSKVLSILSETPFSKGGYIENLDKDEADAVMDEAERRGIFRQLVKAIRSMECVGGCLIYMQTDDEDLTQPLDLSTYDVRNIKDFIHIDPINVAATVVNTSEPAKADYMQPSIWYVIGLGNVHASRFLKFEDNVPESLLRPMCLYFGTPLTNLIKQDVANSNLATQGLANLINRCRYLFFKTDDQSYTTGDINNFKARCRVMSKMQDNFMMTPIKATEDVLQQTTPLTGFSETTEFLYEVISAKTSIPMTELMGTSAKGLNATGEGDRRSWYDRVERLRASVINQTKTMLGIIAGQSDGQFKEVHYRFNALETPTGRELAELRKANLEVAKAVVEMGGNQEQAFDWLKKIDDMGLDGVDFDAESFAGQDDPFAEGTEACSEEQSPFDGIKAQNIWIDNPETFITMKSAKVPLEKGQTSKEAAERFLSDKGRTAKKDKTSEKSGITIEKSTAKAHLLKKDGKTFWVQKRWLKEDGTLTPAGQKAFEEAETDEEKTARKAKEKEDREKGVERPAKADWESEKAYGYDLDLDFYNLEQTQRHRIFIPKSVIQPNGNIPTWILEKKIAEIEETYRNRGGFYIERHPFKGHYFGSRDLTRYDDEEKTSNESVRTSNAVYSIQDYVLKFSTDNGETWENVENDAEEGGMV